ALLGGMLGAILAFALASVRERRDRAVKTLEELETATPWPILTRVPRSRLLDRGAPLSPRAPEAESFRMLRASLRYFSVIGDSPPLPVLSDASSLVAHVSSAIVVAALGKTTPQDLREVSNQLSLLGGDVLGVVANFAPVADYYYQGR